jgi:hypothetical protein
MDKLNGRSPDETTPAVSAAERFEQDCLNRTDKAAYQNEMN